MISSPFTCNEVVLVGKITILQPKPLPDPSELISVPKGMVMVLSPWARALGELCASREAARQSCPKLEGKLGKEVKAT